MKEKILAAIKAKFPTAKLSKVRLDALAKTIEAKAGTDETLIDPALDALNEIYPLTEIAKDDHIRSTLEGKLKATQPPKQDDPPKIDEPANSDDTNSLLKALMEQNKQLAASIAAIQGKEVANTIRGEAAKKLKDIPAAFWSNWAVPEKMEELDGFVEKVTTGYNAFQQELTDKGLGQIPTPGAGSTPPKAQAVSPEVKAFAEKQAALNGAPAGATK